MDIYIYPLVIYTSERGFYVLSKTVIYFEYIEKQGSYLVLSDKRKNFTVKKKPLLKGLSCLSI